jgi:(1->4)-alpha-D-glucan 1-alpha-D-glucosylmutase
MNDRSPLDELCTRCGIETHYIDVWNQRHEAAEQTKLALLRAMGIAIENDADAAAALQRLNEEDWRQLIRPVKVVYEQKHPIRFALNLPQAKTGSTFHWRLSAEPVPAPSDDPDSVGDSVKDSGEFSPASLPVLESRHLAGETYTRYAFDITHTPRPGYYRLELFEQGSQPPLAWTLLIVAPPRCFMPASLAEGKRVWGPALQLYAVRSHGNWGMGDFDDLGEAVNICASAGAGIVGVNPLHALFPHAPEQASPYSPSNRSALNVLYVDVEAVPDFDECAAAQERVRGAEFQATLQRLRESDLVDYAGVARAKLDTLELLYRHFREQHLLRDSLRGKAFRAFQGARGASLRQHALYEALQAHFYRQDRGFWGWPVWPDAYRNPSSPDVERFSTEHLERVEYYEYLQWQADLQLGAAHERAHALHLPVGLYQDLAVGANPGGAETWINAGVHALEARIGAPPDLLNLKGQDWGLPPTIPRKLMQARYAPFITILRDAMRHAGAIRIDHVMGLMRLFWVPPGAQPKDGTYVLYPFADLLGILALESQRHRCLVVGEDLGTVPDAVRTALASLGVLSYRPLYFERDSQGDFKPPEQYPEQALATISTHDLPTLKGFWLGLDLATRQELDLFPSEELRNQQVLERAQDRVRLLLAMERAGVLPAGASINPAMLTQIDPATLLAVHRFLARAPSKLMTVQMEDVFEQPEQVNMPGTTEDRYPSWRRKLPVPLDDWLQDFRFLAISRALSEERGFAAEPRPASATSAGGAPMVIPRATYRLQFHSKFTFDMATRIVPYLARLGISHVYASPFLKARPGSTHGYDITDHNAFNPEIGTEEEFDRFVHVLRQHGMGLMADIVPNHMGVMESDNAWWLDVLENGPAALHGQYFDIEWNPLSESLRGKVLIPILGEQYGASLEKGELKLHYDAPRGEFSICYYKHRFPIDPREYPRILGAGLDRLTARTGNADPLIAEFQSLITSFGHLPPRQDQSADKRAERVRDKELRKRQLAELCARSREIGQFIEENVAMLNGKPGRAESFDLLHQLLEAQAFRLAHWRVAGDDINYRRFFDINDLAALRMESEAVFEDTHRLVFRLLSEGKLDALRIDHPDGLYDPQQYFERLQRRGAAHLPDPNSGTALAKSIYLTVEKILAEHEHLPAEWPVHGTTGYEFLNQVNGLFVDSSGEKRIDRVYSSFIGRHIDYPHLLRESKALIIVTTLSSELNVLANLLNRIAKADRSTRDFTLNSLRRALVDVVVCFPVYRTYLNSEGEHSQDRQYIDQSIGMAKNLHASAETSIFDFIHAVLTGDHSLRDAGYRELVRGFIGRFQQFTAPVTAKAMEDTSFYIYNRLASLNEVGGNPLVFAVPLPTFHALMQERARAWPHSMLATSTHDNKRSEDVRARINLLSEMPAAWRLALSKWSRLNRRRKKRAGADLAPSRNDEYLLYQALLGAWPLQELDQSGLDAFRDRIQRYMLKAVREAKVHTSWVNPNQAYESALASFIDALLKSRERNPFLDAFLDAQPVLARLGMLNSLSQTLIKLTAPGVPDLYQGNETWDFSLVDPDNRRPVDYAARADALEALRTRFPGEDAEWREQARGLLSSLGDGRIKLYLCWRALALRARWPSLFEEGEYLPIPASGQRAEHVCAFARRHGEHVVIAVAPRLYYGLSAATDGLPLGAAVWGDTRIAVTGGAEYRDLLTGRRFTADGPQAALALAELLADLPVALLAATIGD